MKYQMLAILSKKLIVTQELMKLKRNLLNDKHITTPEFNKLTAENFAARLAQANLVTKTGFDNKLSILIEKLLQIKQSIYLLKMN